MKHIFEFIATLKPKEEGGEQEQLKRIFVTKGNRVHKVADSIYKELWERFQIPQTNIEDFKIRQIR